MTMLKKRMKNVLFMGFMALLSACASTSGLITDGSNAAPGSSFSKLELDMGKSQVRRIIGKPDDSKTYPTAKRWLPYYYGTDTTRQEFFYRSEGRLIFGGNQRLIKIIVDQDEDGFQ